MKTGGETRDIKLEKQNANIEREEEVETEKSKTQANLLSACDEVQKHIEQVLDLCLHSGDTRNKSLAKVKGFYDEVAVLKSKIQTLKSEEN